MNCIKCGGDAGLEPLSREQRKYTSRNQYMCENGHTFVMMEVAPSMASKGTKLAQAVKVIERRIIRNRRDMAIRDAHNKGATAKELASQYKVTDTRIKQIINR